MLDRRDSYAEKVNGARLMAEGMRQNLEELAKVGLDEAFVQELENQKQQVEDIDASQERLKADLKSTTETLDREMAKLEEMVARARKLVKIQIPQSRWKEFGIGVSQ
jgi:hypothetical protein